MISHKYKCIFIHIPRTGGTSIELSLCGRTWDRIDLKTKHVPHEVARKRYARYWNEYFKFSFVRNPFDWLVSMWSLSMEVYNSKRRRRYKMAPYFTTDFKEFVFTMTRYCKPGYYGQTWIPGMNKIEHVDRMHAIQVRNLAGIDFIGKYEKLQQDFERLCTIINAPKKKLPITAPSTMRHKNYKLYYDEQLKLAVSKCWYPDLHVFNYRF